MILRLISIILFIGFFAPTQGQDFERIQHALAKSDADILSSHFDQMVEFCVNKDEYFLSAAEAKTKIREFFKANTVTAFDLVHKGSSPDKGSQYMIGTLVTSKGKFRTYIYLEEFDGKGKIQEIRFDSE